MIHSLFFYYHIMTIKLENVWNRNFNGVWPGETINVEEENKNTYIVAGFKEVETSNEEEVEKTLTLKELKEKATELNIEFAWNISKAKLSKLIEEVETSNEDKKGEDLKEWEEK